MKGQASKEKPVAPLIDSSERSESRLPTPETACLPRSTASGIVEEDPGLLPSFFPSFLYGFLFIFSSVYGHTFS